MPTTIRNEYCPAIDQHWGAEGCRSHLTKIEHLFDDCIMRGDPQYVAGYNAGRTACVRQGTSSGLRDEISKHADAAYRAGWEWACFDYDDANGLAALPLHLIRNRSAAG